MAVKTHRTVNLDVFKEYITINEPVGLEKLSVATTIPSHSIRRILYFKKAPNHLAQEKLCSVLGKSLDEVFPLAKRKAS